MKESSHFQSKLLQISLCLIERPAMLSFELEKVSRILDLIIKHLSNIVVVPIPQNSILVLELYDLLLLCDAHP
jgi:hypothetical protein